MHTVLFPSCRVLLREIGQSSNWIGLLLIHLLSPGSPIGKEEFALNGPKPKNRCQGWSRSTSLSSEVTSGLEKATEAMFVAVSSSLYSSIAFDSASGTGMGKDSSKKLHVAHNRGQQTFLQWHRTVGATHMPSCTRVEHAQMLQVNVTLHVVMHAHPSKNPSGVAM